MSTAEPTTEPDDPGRAEATQGAAPPDRQPPAHASRPPLRLRRLAAIAGVAAAVTGIAVGTLALLRLPGSTESAPTSLHAITVSEPPAAVLPLSAAEIIGLLDRTPDFGSLPEPHRRASCLTGLGYPGSAAVLGAEPIEIAGKPAVLLLLAGEHPDTVVALAVAPTCSSADTGVITDTTVDRPPQAGEHRGLR